MGGKRVRNSLSSPLSPLSRADSPRRRRVVRDGTRSEHWFDFVMRSKDAAGNPFRLVGWPGLATATEYVVLVGTNMPDSLDELCRWQF